MTTTTPDEQVVPDLVDEYSETIDTQKATVTIVGGGSSAHVLIPFLSGTGHVVNLLTRRPAAWKHCVSVELHTRDEHDNDDTEETVEAIPGTLHKISCDPSVVIPDADVVILCMPVHQYRNALHRLAPYINRHKSEVMVGTLYGQAGFHWMCHEVERKLQLTNVTCFAVGLIPWICRTLEYGSKGVNYGCKQHNIVAVTPAHRFERLEQVLLNDICYHWHGTGKFLQACSFLSLTLSVDNQIIHPSRCYGLWQRYGGKWPTEQDIPYFYKDFDALSADILRSLDADYSKIRQAVRRHFPQRSFAYMMDYLALERFTHQSHNVDIQKTFQQSIQLGRIKTPCVQVEKTGEWELDIHCRFFTDDIPYGLLIAKWIAEQLNVDTPFLDEIITWAQKLHGWKFLAEDGKLDVPNAVRNKFTSGIPPAYGITSIDAILD